MGGVAEGDYDMPAMPKKPKSSKEITSTQIDQMRIWLTIWKEDSNSEGDATMTYNDRLEITKIHRLMHELNVEKGYETDARG